MVKPDRRMPMMMTNTTVLLLLLLLHYVLAVKRLNAKGSVRCKQTPSSPETSSQKPGSQGDVTELQSPVGEAAPSRDPDCDVSTSSLKGSDGTGLGTVQVIRRQFRLLPAIWRWVLWTGIPDSY